MRYHSTRGGVPAEGFLDMLLTGLAGDGGLWTPLRLPAIADPKRFAQRSYQDAAFDVLSGFVAGAFKQDELRLDIRRAYARFDDPAIAPLVPLGNGRYLLELFHGPTFAFKDIALQLLACLFARALSRRGGRATIVAATSGDTGSAAIAAFGGLQNIDLFVLHPKGRISEVQRRQMTTATFANVHNIALEGSFDDAQAIVKALFADRDFAERRGLTAVNSINFARIAAQAVYYFTAAAQLDRAPIFVVPTGNFGDIFAGDLARRMGLPAHGLVAATNGNDILARALNHGVYESGAALQTLSPSMDIQVASNFERALYFASYCRDEWVADAMAQFARTRRLELPPTILGELRERYSAQSASDDETLSAMQRMHARHGRLIDPHTAVGWAVAERIETDAPVIVLSTAHPAKFPDAVKRACGVEPEMPERLRALFDLPERCDTLPADVSAVRGFVESKV